MKRRLVNRADSKGRPFHYKERSNRESEKPFSLFPIFTRPPWSSSLHTELWGKKMSTNFSSSTVKHHHHTQWRREQNKSRQAKVILAKNLSWLKKKIIKRNLAHNCNPYFLFVCQSVEDSGPINGEGARTGFTFRAFCPQIVVPERLVEVWWRRTDGAEEEVVVDEWVKHGALIQENGLRVPYYF